MKLFLIRHAQTPLNAQHILDTVIPGPELTELGRAQADALAETLSGQGIQAIYASELTRTQRTAAPLAEVTGLPVLIRPGLHEIPAGDYEGLGGADAYHGYQSTMMGWITNLNRRMPGERGEDGAEFFARYDGAMATICQDGHDCVAVISHGAAIRVWAGRRAENLPSDFGSENYLPNTGIAVLEGDMSAGWLLRSWNGVPIS